MSAWQALADRQLHGLGPLRISIIQGQCFVKLIGMRGMCHGVGLVTEACILPQNPLVTNQAAAICILVDAGRTMPVPRPLESNCLSWLNAHPAEQTLPVRGLLLQF